MRLSMFLAGLVVMLAAGNGDAADTKDYEPVFKGMVEQMNKLADVLADATDKETAAKAQPELKKAVEKFNEWSAKLEKLGKPSEEQAKELKAKFGKDQTAAGEKLEKQLTRLATADYAKDLLKELEKLK